MIPLKDKSILVIGNSNSSTIAILSNMLNYTSNITLLLIEDKLHYNTSDLVKYCKSNNIYCPVFFILIKIASPTKQIPELKIINAVVPCQKKFS